MQKITPFLWFADQAEAAAELYVSVFDDGRILRTTRYSEASSEAARRPAGSVMTVEVELAGQRFVLLNGGPVFQLTEAVSFVIDCADQDEVDHYWDALTEGGEPGACGWLKDRFGLSWQVVPKALGELLSYPDRGRAQRALDAMLAMSKIDVAALHRAADGKEAS